VATKADRISSNQRRASMLKLAERLGVADDQIVPFSAKSRIGHDELWAAIKSATGVETAGPREAERTGS
jgi:GTP-binding protein EngB required for normal cell division